MATAAPGAGGAPRRMAPLTAGSWRGHRRAFGAAAAGGAAFAAASAGLALAGDRSARGTAARLMRTLRFAAATCSAHCRETAPLEARLAAEPSDAAARQALSRLHRSCAASAAALCAANGGVYAKAAQFAAATGALPPEYTDALAALQDDAPPRPFAEVERTLKRELGARRYAEAFTSIDRAPIAAASLAQVHLATLSEAYGGGEVAVKVQYEGVGEQLGADMALMVLLAEAAGWATGGRFALSWAPRALQRRLREELDFRHEARNAAECARAFSDGSGSTPTIAVPAARADLTTRRVLVMERVRGARADDAAALRVMKIEPRDVARALTEALAAMLFRHGALHADMHPGNVLVRLKVPAQPAQAQLEQSKRRRDRLLASLTRAAHANRATAAAAAARTPRPQFEVVLLDHGHYCHLPETLRKSYACLWAGLGQRDAATCRKAAVALGVAPGEADYYPLLFGADKAAKRVAWQAIDRETQRALAADVRERERRGSVAADMQRFHMATRRELLDVAKAHALLGGLVAALWGDGSGGASADGEWMRLSTLMRVASQAEPAIAARADETEATPSHAKPVHGVAASLLASIKTLLPQGIRSDGSVDGLRVRRCDMLRPSPL